MKRVFMLIFMTASLLLSAAAQDQKAATLRTVLLEQLRTTHNQKEWFVPANVAVEGVTPEQANWTDGKGNHSIGQLTYHLLFWDRWALAKFKGEDPGKFSGNNDDTFNNFDSKQWSATVRELDEVMTAWEKAVEAADEEKLKKEASTIAKVGAHNAYHIGQIIYVRKEQGSWDSVKGVK
jgi:hypothetical protein